MELILGSFAREIKSPRALDLRYSGAPDVPRTLDARAHRSSLSSPTPQLPRRIARVRDLSDARAPRAQRSPSRSWRAERAICTQARSARSRGQPDARGLKNVDCVAAAGLGKARARAGFHTFVALTPRRGLHIVN
jgi:hypothetical protein